VIGHEHIALEGAPGGRREIRDPRGGLWQAGRQDGFCAMTLLRGVSLPTPGQGFQWMTAGTLPIPWSRLRSTSGRRKSRRWSMFPLGARPARFRATEVKSLWSAPCSIGFSRTTRLPTEVVSATYCRRRAAGPPCLERHAVRQCGGYARNPGRSAGALTDPSDVSRRS
jgi:hypothetical protein